MTDPFPYNFTLPACPDVAALTNNLEAPSTFLLWILVSLVSLVFAAVIFVLYNSVELPHINQKIRTQNISNTAWILYYSCIAVRGVVNTVRFGRKDIDPQSRFYWAMSITADVLHGLTVLFLSLALNYQRKYRSGEVNPSGDTEVLNGGASGSGNGGQSASSSSSSVADALRPPTMLQRVIKFLTSVETLVVFLLFFVYVLLYIRVSQAVPANIMAWVHLGGIVLQRLPVIFLVGAIIYTRRNMEVGPTRASKFVLVLAVLCNLPNDLPLGFWNYISKDAHCALMFASVPDIVILLYFISLFFWFYFMRSEYMRNQEETMFTAVAQSQDFFDFRKFY